VQLGMIGLGRMGSNLVRRLQRAGHDCVVYDVVPAAVRALSEEGFVGTGSLAELVSRLDTPRAVWVMVPAAFAHDTIAELAQHLDPDDVIIDGGNSFWQDDVDRAEVLARRNIHYLDVGTSGGVFGLERGFCLMIGGEAGPVTRLEPIFQALAPGVDAAERTPARAAGDAVTPEEHGYLHCGPAGSGHYVKMVHNGIEYGLMAALAEGINVLHHANAGADRQDHDAETTPLRDPHYYRYDFDVAAITEVWRRGSVVASWLMDLTAQAMVADPGLEGFAGRVSDSGEGRWTLQAAVETGAPAPVLATALFNRFASRGEADFGDKMLSAMRQQFGGHQEQPPAPEGVRS
jgi:6-phosphogluconate dehydrogenase